MAEPGETLLMMAETEKLTAQNVTGLLQRLKFLEGKVLVLQFIVAILLVLQCVMAWKLGHLIRP